MLPPASREALRTPWRWPAVAAALVAAYAHVPITRQHLHEAPYIGWSFVALEVSLTVLAVLLVVRDVLAVWWAAAVVPALAIVVYVLSRSVGLPQIADDKGNWTDPLGVVAVLFEALLVGCAVKVCAGRATRDPEGPGWLPVAGSGVLLVVGVVAVVRAVAAGGG